MVELLIRYAQDHRLVAEPGFAPETARWGLHFDQSGTFTGSAVPLGDASASRNRGREFDRAPKLQKKTVAAIPGGGSHFLIESAEVVALYRPKGTNAEGKHAFFVSLLRESAQAVPVFGALATALEDPGQLQRIHRTLEALKAKSTDKVTLIVDGRFAVEDPRWHDWWRRKCASLEAVPDDGVRMVCTATGEVCLPVDRHRTIVGIEKAQGATQAEILLVSFDKPAFESYRLQAGQNAAMSDGAVQRYRTALNLLLRAQSAKLVGTKIVYWFSKGIPDEDDPFPELQDDLRSDPATEARAITKVRQLLQSLRSGTRPDLLDAEYYAAVLSGSGGRVMVRDFLTGRFEDLVAAIDAWFTDLEITTYDGAHVTRPPKLEAVITSLLPARKPKQEYEDWVRPAGFARLPLWHAALAAPEGQSARRQIPYAVLAAVILQHRSFVQTGSLEDALKDGRGKDASLSLLQTRMGLAKAYWLRKEGDQYVKTFLDENHPHQAYHCGRLMAVYANLQMAAQNYDVNAGVVQRFYAAASTTPALVLTRLSRLSNHHLSKLDPGLSRFYLQKISAINAKIQASPTSGYPRFLSLEEQSLFALGYYHQMAADWPRRKAGDPAPDEDGLTDALDNDSDDTEGESDD